VKSAAAPSRLQGVRVAFTALQSGLAPFAAPLLLALAVYLGLFFRLGDFPLFDVDEGAFSEATREMLERGDFITTWLNGQLRFDKPILTYWLQAASVSVFGLDEFGLRLPSALASTGWVAAIFVFTRQQAGKRAAFAAALIAATTLGVTVIGRGAIADALLNLFVALAMFDIYRYMQEPRVRYRRRAWAWMAFGVLTKGPVALLVPGAASLLALILQGKLRQWWRAVRDPVGWLILLAVAGPWYLAEYHRQGQAFINGFFLRHNVERFVSPLQGHGGGLFYYLPVLLLLLLPFTGLFLRILPGVRRLAASPLHTLLWCWFLFVFVFFSLASTKLPHYLIYGLTPLFVLMALQRDVPVSRLLAFTPPLALLAFVACLPNLALHFGPRIRNLYFREMLSRTEVFAPGWQLCAAALLLCGLGLALMPRTAVWPRLAASALLCSFAVGGLLLPAVAALQQGPVKEAALIARATHLPVRTWQFNVPSFSLYRGAVTERAEVLHRGDVILTRSDELQRLGDAQVLYRKGGVVLARIQGERNTP
jgi:4-amino-4-deoxy-L-arabinose transferase-like glycosyltransferase